MTSPNTPREAASAEAARLAALAGMDILDSPPEAIFDSLTRLAALTFDAPITLVSLVDAERQWFKSCIGLDTRETARNVAFCDYAIRSPETLVVLDATKDSRFRSNPLVTGKPGIRFYAGAPLIVPDGHRLGTLCVIDTDPRPEFDAAACAKLEAMAAAVTDALIMRRDISNRDALAREQKVNRALLEQADELAGLGQCSWDVRTGVVTWSPVIHRIHGREVSLGAPDLAEMMRYYHPDDAAVMATAIERAVKYGEPCALNVRIIRPDGELRHVTVRGACEVDEAGNTTVLYSTFVDITDLRIADEATRLNAERLSFLMEQSADVIVRIEPTKGVTWVSPSCRSLGYQPDELLGHKSNDLIHPDDLPNTLEVRAARFAGLPDPPGSTREQRVRHKDGRWILFEGNPTVVRNADGETVEIINILRDVTVHRELAEALKTAREAAETVTRVKSDFMANMSHEIRTPLTAIIGYTNLLAECSGLDATAQTYLARVKTANRILLSIVNDVLDFSRLEAGQISVKTSPEQPSSLIRDCLMLFAPQADAKGLIIDFDVVDTLPERVDIDPHLTRQILLNLIGNAVKFTDSGHVRVRTGHDPVSGRLSVWVEDTGLGMDDGLLAQLFQRFSQVDASSTRRHGGTGLGLAISRGLAEAMGGVIEVVSVVGRGTTFLLQLPAPISEAIHENETPASLRHEAPLRDVRLLVIDDNPNNLELASVVFGHLGADVTQARSGAEGLATAQSTPVDAILLDLRMPGMSGPSLLGEIRAGGGPNQTAPVLAFTAGPAPMQEMQALGFDGVVRKPMVSQHALNAIRAAIRGFDNTECEVAAA